MSKSIIKETKKSVIPIVPDKRDDCSIAHYRHGCDDNGRTIGHHLNEDNGTDGDSFFAHRNNTYSFIILEKGRGSIILDYNKVELQERDTLFIAPGQVHAEAEEANADYWFIEVPVYIIPPHYLAIFDGKAPFQGAERMSPATFDKCSKLLSMLLESFRETDSGKFGKLFRHELLQAIICLIAETFSTDIALTDNQRSLQITRDFKMLLKEKILHEKKPSSYAALLNLSESYLNEIVKESTGLTVGLWIRQQILLEAKRLLLHTELDVKEVSYKLGLENYSYFTRIFKKLTGTTPLEFRRQYRK